MLLYVSILSGLDCWVFLLGFFFFWMVEVVEEGKQKKIRRFIYLVQGFYVEGVKIKKKKSSSRSFGRYRRKGSILAPEN